MFALFFWRFGKPSPSVIGRSDFNRGPVLIHASGHPVKNLVFCPRSGRVLGDCSPLRSLRVSMMMRVGVWVADKQLVSPSANKGSPAVVPVFIAYYILSRRARSADSCPLICPQVKRLRVRLMMSFRMIWNRSRWV